MPIQFCPACHNLLYPTEDVVNRRLEYECRRAECRQKVYGVDSLVEIHDLKGGVSKLGASVQDLAAHADDATLQRVHTILCPSCQTTKGVVLFMNPYRLDPENMGLICVCVNCRHVWDRKEMQRD